MGALGQRTTPADRPRRHRPGIPLSTPRSSRMPPPRWGRCTRAASGSDSGPARRSTSTSSAASGRRSASAANAVRSDRGHQQALHRRGGAALRRVLHARERQALHPARPAGADLRRHRRPDQREAHRTPRRRDDHGRGGRREDQDAVGQVRGGRPAVGPGSAHHAEAAPDPRLVGRDAGRGRVERSPRVAERRHALPEAGHPSPGGLRQHGRCWFGPSTSPTGS